MILQGLITTFIGSVLLNGAALWAVRGSLEQHDRRMEIGMRVGATGQIAQIAGMVFVALGVVF